MTSPIGQLAFRRTLICGGFAASSRSAAIPNRKIDRERQCPGVFAGVGGGGIYPGIVYLDVIETDGEVGTALQTSELGARFGAVDFSFQHQQLRIAGFDRGKQRASIWIFKTRRRGCWFPEWPREHGITWQREKGGELGTLARTLLFESGQSITEFADLDLEAKEGVEVAARADAFFDLRCEFLQKRKVLSSQFDGLAGVGIIVKAEPDRACQQ